MLTLPLEKMASRVAGSLCLATGVGEEMVVNRYLSANYLLDPITHTKTSLFLLKLVTELEILCGTCFFSPSSVVWFS